MDEKPGETVEGRAPEPEAAPRRPIWPVALFLGGLVVALLGAAVLLDQRYRAPIGVEPVSAIVATPIAVSNPAAQATTLPAIVFTASAAPTVLPNAIATRAATTTTVPTVAAVRSSGSPAPGQAVLTPLQKEIVDAYLRYWDIRIKAYYAVDTSRLKEVMAGDELAREEAQINELRAQGRAVRFDVQHDFRVLAASSDAATVYDEYVNRSRVVDATTKQELPSSKGEITEKISFEFKKLDGTWKVVDGAQHD